MDLNAKKMTCINCCCSVTNMERNNTKNLNLFLISVFGNVLHSKSTVLNDITICNNCNSYANKLWNYRNNFLKQTNPESRITRITEQDVKVKKFFGLDKDVEMPNVINEEFITCDSETPCQSQKEIIAPKTESDSYEKGLNEETVKREVEDTVKGEVVEIVSDIYDEKYLELKIPKLQLSELHQKRLSKTVNPVHSCEKCGRNFESQENLQTHVQNAHTSVEYNFSCHFCKKSFSYYWFYKNHLKINHGGIEMTFCCSICRKVVHSQKELDQHSFFVHQITSHPFKCNFCDVAFETVEEIEKLRNHLIESHGDTKEAEAARANVSYQTEKDKWTSRKLKPCNFCGKLIKENLARSVHILFEHQDHKSCKICKETFDSEKDFYGHIHSPEHPLHTCPVCGVRVSNMSKLFGHLENVHLEKCFRFSCEMCGSSFRGFDRMKNHYRYHSMKASSNRFSCNQCDKFFIFKYELNIHILDVHSHKSNKTDELIKCNYCERTFKGIRRNKYLRKHKLKCHPESLQKETDLAFKCLEPECGLKFSSSQALHVHKRRHIYGLNESSRNLKYGNVDQASENLIKVVMKDSVKKFQCGMCETIVSTRSILYRHLFHIHAVKLNSIKYDAMENVKCEICGKMSNDKYKLKKHMATVHKGSTTKSPGLLPSDALSKNIFKVVVKDNVKKYQCGMCETIIARRYHMYKHLLRQHEIRFSSIKYGTVEKVKCDVCNKIFRDKYHLKGHMSSFHEGSLVPGDKHYLQQYKCTLCDTICIATSGIRDHFLASHPDTPGSNAAANNVKRVKEDTFMGLKSDWNLVQKDTTEKIENFCKPCNNLFLTISDKYAHDCQHHEALLECKTCKEEFSSENNLKKHQFSHSTLNCHHCVSAFDCVEDYYEHLQTKHTLQPYICEFCGLFFSTKRRIWSHYRVHCNNHSVTGSSKDKTDQHKKVEEKNRKSEPSVSNIRRSGRIPHKKAVAYDSTDSDTSISDSSYSEYSN